MKIMNHGCSTRPARRPHCYAGCARPRRPLPAAGSWPASEPKWDGYRGIATLGNGQVSIASRRGLDMAAWLTEFQGLTDALDGHQVVLDGELVALDPAATRNQGLEGVVAKRLGGPYRPGRRHSDWRKLAHDQQAVFLVGGYEPGPAGVERLLLGAVDASGGLRHVASVQAGLVPALRCPSPTALGRPTIASSLTSS